MFQSTEIESLLKKKFKISLLNQKTPQTKKGVMRLAGEPEDLELQNYLHFSTGLIIREQTSNKDLF